MSNLHDKQSPPGGNRSAQGLTCAALIFACASLVALGVVPGSCVANHPGTCTKSSDCANSFCDGQGFCAQECTSNADCPCSSFCSVGCGLCLTVAQKNLATCFALQQNASPADVLGTCYSRPSVAAIDGSTDGSVNPSVPGDAGACQPQVPLTCTVDAQAPATMPARDAAPRSDARTDAKASEVRDGPSDARMNDAPTAEAGP